MKKIIILFSIIMTILIFSTVSFANSDIQIAVNGNSLGVPKVNVLMDGNVLKSEVPSFIMGDRTLVPIRFVAESFGAVVDWEDSTKTATISHQGSRVDLSIDSDLVIVNGEKIKLDGNSTPKLVTFKELKDSRTMVPVRFISEVLGYQVGWDKGTYTAKISSPTLESPSPKNVSIENIDLIKSPGGNHSLLIKSDGAIKYTTSFLSGTNKLIFDIENSTLSTSGNFSIPNDMTVMDEVIQRVQYSQFTIDPNTTRIVLTLSQDLEAKIEVASDKKETRIYFKEDVLVEEAPVNFRGNNISSISLEEVDGNEAIVIKGANNVKYNTMKLSNPDRLVIDLMDSFLQGESLQTFSYDTSFIKGVRVSQFVPDNNYNPKDKIVRLVLDLKEGQAKADVSIISKDDSLVIYPKEDMWKDIKYNYLNNQALIDIKNLAKTDYQIFYDTERKDLYIEIPNENTNLPEGLYSINDRLVKEINVERSRRFTNIRVSFKQNIAYNVLSSMEDEKISVLVTRDSNIIPSERTIVIDPGHGGKDSGAVAGSVYEKHITTPVSLLLRDALMQNGYNVIMTRVDDVDLGLYDRPIIANNANADLFISIHANASLKPQVKGLEVLYCPANERDIKLEDQHPFAKAIHDNIRTLTNRPGRGIVKRSDLVVLNRTYMPAVLVEIGYMSNAEELQVILREDYQNLIVQGILNGVKEYLGD